MFKYMKARRDGMKCQHVLASCRTFEQVNTAYNMIHNYGKMYNYNGIWFKLERRAFKFWNELLDKLEYEERLKEIEQETSTNTEGESV